MNGLTDINRKELAKHLINYVIIAEIVIAVPGLLRGRGSIGFWGIIGLAVGLAFGIARYFDWHSRQQTREEEQRAIARFPQLR
jgi:hypothetical protein